MKVDALWSDTADGLLAEASYLSESQEYEVTVTMGSGKLSKRFPAAYEPRFGIDVDDMKQICEIAEELSKSLGSPR